MATPTAPKASTVSASTPGVPASVPAPDAGLTATQTVRLALLVGLFASGRTFTTSTLEANLAVGMKLVMESVNHG